MLRFQTIDAHSGGDPLRLIVSGFPAPKGKSMAEKREWAATDADHIRRALMLEPRGHRDMRGALLTEPVAPASHAGLLFMDATGYPAMSGHGVIAVTTVALQRGLMSPGGDGRTVVFDTPAGTITARAGIEAGGAGEAGRAGDAGGAGGASEKRAPSDDEVRVERVSFENVPSFVLHAGIPVNLPNRLVRADVAFGGEFYAIVDSEAAGVGVDLPHVPELRRTGVAIIRAIESTRQVVHPLNSDLSGIQGVVFTGPPSDGSAGIRSATVSAGGQLARSPDGTSTAAIMAVLDAMGLLAGNEPFVHESIIGSLLTGRIREAGSVGDYPAIVAELEGSAWITGEHAFVVEESDPFAGGFSL